MCLLHLPRFAAQYHRLMAPNPPDHPTRPPCTLKTWWSTAPPYHMSHAAAGEAQADHRLARFCRMKGGDE